MVPRKRAKKAALTEISSLGKPARPLVKRKQISNLAAIPEHNKLDSGKKKIKGLDHILNWVCVCALKTNPIRNPTNLA